MGVKERKERERLKRSNDILEAARQLFEARGFLNTTLQDVARAAEISVGLIYRYFESKEDIFASLALKGAEQFDGEIEEILSHAQKDKRKMPPDRVLEEIALRFFSFYQMYGEYFDLLLYSYKGMKEVKIHSHTITKLMSITLLSVDRLKTYILEHPKFKAREEEEALQSVFLLWGILLGTHKLIDSSGRGHLFAFQREDFLKHIVRDIFCGIGEQK